MDVFRRVVLLFFIYSIIGWLWETFYCSLKAKKFVYRGFLVGPYCPIYGFGIVSVLYFVEPYQDNIVVLYLFSAILVTVLEYVTSYLLERFFHATWWDYHDVPLNINGRIAVPISLFWGLACVLIVKIIHPVILTFTLFLEKSFGNILPIVLVILITLDLIYTVTNMVAFQKTMTAWSQAIESASKELTEQVKMELTEKKTQLKVTRSDLLRHLHEKSKESLNLPKINFNQRRILKNFNHLKIKNIPNINELKATIKEFHLKNK